MHHITLLDLGSFFKVKYAYQELPYLENTARQTEGFHRSISLIWFRNTYNYISGLINTY